MGAQGGPPMPPALATPRRSRVAPRYCARTLYEDRVAPDLCSPADASARIACVDIAEDGVEPEPHALEAHRVGRPRHQAVHPDPGLKADAHPGTYLAEVVVRVSRLVGIEDLADPRAHAVVHAALQGQDDGEEMRGLVDERGHESARLEGTALAHDVGADDQIGCNIRDDHAPWSGGRQRRVEAHARGDPELPDPAFPIGLDHLDPEPGLAKHCF